MTAPMMIDGTGQRTYRARKPNEQDDPRQAVQQQYQSVANPTNTQGGNGYSRTGGGQSPYEPPKQTYSGLTSNQQFMQGVDPNDPRSRTADFAQFMAARQQAVQGQQGGQGGQSPAPNMATYAPQPYRARSVVTGQPIGGQQPPMMSAQGNAPSRDPALDARYIGKSGGKQRFLGTDGNEYTNVDREQAIARGLGSQEDGLATAWQNEMAGDQTRQGQSQAGLDEATTGLRNVRGRLSAYQPTNSQSFDPSRLENMQPTDTMATRPTWQQDWNADALTNFRSNATEGVSTNALDTYSPTALSKVNTDRVANYDGGQQMQRYLQQSGGNAPISVQAGGSSFDPTEALNTYARGAASQAKYVLQDALEQTRNSAAAGGRIDSGLFDKDNGQVIQRVGNDLSDQISARALDAAGIKAGIEQSNAQNTTQAAIAQGNLAGDARGLRSAEARQAGQLGLDALTSAMRTDADVANNSDDLRLRGATNATDAQLRRANTMDSNRLTATDSAARLNLTRAQGVDDSNQRRSEFTDTFRQGNTRDTLDMQQRRGEFLDNSALDALVASGQLSRGEAELYASMNNDNLNRTGDRIASERDRIQGRQNFNTQSKAQGAQSKRDMWGNIIGGVTGVVGAYAGGR